MASRKKVSVVLGATSRHLTQTSDKPCCSRSLNHESDDCEMKDAASSSGVTKMFPNEIDGDDYDEAKAKEGAHAASKFCFQFFFFILHYCFLWNRINDCYDDAPWPDE